MFYSLRGKLIVSYVGLVLLCLLLSGLAAGVLVTRVQRRVNLVRTQTVTVALAQRIKNLPRLNASMPGLSERLVSEGERLGGRILITDAQGKVLIDSQGDYKGEHVPLPRQFEPPSRQPRPASGLPPNVRRHVFEDGKVYFVVFVELAPNEARSNARFLGLALEVAAVDPPWREVFRPLLIVGLSVLLLSIVIGCLLARSITRPVSKMTEAAAGIAGGDYDQMIPVRGKDEIARLAGTFNHMAREVDRAQRSQRDFLTNVSHDLKTPLTSIQGFSQAILEGAVTDAPGYRRAAEIIHGEADHMLQLVQDLLELARLETGQLDLATEPIRLGEMASYQVEQARCRAQAAALTFRVVLPADLPGVRADGKRLGQAVANLVDNACKYAPSGSEIRVEGTHLTARMPRPKSLPVAFGAGLRQGEWVGLSITNRSAPIPATDLPRIFERFYRGDAARQRSEGSGLGLAIVRETILAHGGRVEAASDESGTRFRVWLPVA